MREPNLKSLKVFNAAAQHLNFRLAAENLYVTRGAVAQHIRQLEQDLGVKLFHRLARGLALTPEGELYYQSIRQALQLIDEATKTLTAANNRVTVGMTPTMAAKWLLPRLALFEAQYPDIDLQVVTGESSTEAPAEDTDITICYGNLQAGKSTDGGSLVAINLLAVCSLDYARKHCAEYATNESLTAFQVEDPKTFSIHRLIHDKHNYWDNWLKEMALPPAKRMLVFNLTSLSIDAAINGQGITLVPGILVRDHLKRGELVSLWRFDSAESGYYLSAPKAGDNAKPAVSSVHHWLRDLLIATAA